MSGQRGHRLSLWSRPGGRASWQGHCGCGRSYGPAHFRGDIELAHERHLAELAEEPDASDDEADHSAGNSVSR